MRRSSLLNFGHWSLVLFLIRSHSRRGYAVAALVTFESSLSRSSTTRSAREKRSARRAAHALGDQRVVDMAWRTFSKALRPTLLSASMTLGRREGQNVYLGNFKGYSGQVSTVVSTIELYNLPEYGG